jgi:hypothetical protein
MQVEKRILSTAASSHTFKSQNNQDQGFNMIYERIRGIVQVETDDSQEY